MWLTLFAAAEWFFLANKPVLILEVVARLVVVAAIARVNPLNIVVVV